MDCWVISPVISSSPNVDRRDASVSVSGGTFSSGNPPPRVFAAASETPSVVAAAVSVEAAVEGPRLGRANQGSTASPSTSPSGARAPSRAGGDARAGTRLGRENSKSESTSEPGPDRGGSSQIDSGRERPSRAVCSSAISCLTISCLVMANAGARPTDRDRGDPREGFKDPRAAG